MKHFCPLKATHNCRLTLAARAAAARLFLLHIEQVLSTFWSKGRWFFDPQKSQLFVAPQHCREFFPLCLLLPFLSLLVRLFRVSIQLTSICGFVTVKFCIQLSSSIQHSIALQKTSPAFTIFCRKFFSSDGFIGTLLWSPFLVHTTISETKLTRN